MKHDHIDKKANQATAAIGKIASLPANTMREIWHEWNIAMVTASPPSEFSALHREIWSFISVYGMIKISSSSSPHCPPCLMWSVDTQAQVNNSTSDTVVRRQLASNGVFQHRGHLASPAARCPATGTLLYATAADSATHRRRGEHQSGEWEKC